MQFVAQPEPSRLSTGPKEGQTSTKKDFRPVLGELSTQTPQRTDLTSTEIIKSARPSGANEKGVDRRFSNQSSVPTHVKTRQSFDKENMGQNFEFVQPAEVKRLSTHSIREEAEWQDNRNLDLDFKRKSVAGTSNRDSYLKTSEVRFSDSQVLSQTLQSSEGLTQRLRTSGVSDTRRKSGDGLGSARQSLGESIAESEYSEETEVTGARRFLRYLNKKTLAKVSVAFVLFFVAFLIFSSFAGKSDSDVFEQVPTELSLENIKWEKLSNYDSGATLEGLEQPAFEKL